jgi:dienelactone hydrolase
MVVIDYRLSTIDVYAEPQLKRGILDNMPLSGFTETTFESEEVTYPIFRCGTGPGVVIMPEIPGFTPTTADLGRRVADSGFTVVIPSLFGTPGRKFSLPYVGLQFIRICISREFHVLASNHSSPVTDWLRALCREVHSELGGPGVGVLVLCLTGNFALSLMVDPVVMAPVMSEPALPFPVSSARKKGIHLNQEDLSKVKERVRDGVSVLGLRFTHDFMCPSQRFEALQQELGNGFEAIEIKSGPGNPHNIKRLAHSVLTEEFVDKEGHPTREALDRVITFFQQRLITQGGS